MRDPDAVLDWVTQEHLQRFGPTDFRSFDHIFAVVDMFRNWDRSKDAVAYLEQVLHQLEDSDMHVQPNGPQPSMAAASSSSHAVRESGATPTSHGPFSNVSIQGEGPIEHALIDAQLRGGARGTQRDEGRDVFLLRLIKHCEEYPKELAKHSVLCWTASGII
jgi:hypothetical protein